jgi:hypothetical protein
MRASHKLGLYAAGLAVVLGASMAVGAATDPTGLANAEPAKEAHGGEMVDGMVPGLASADEGFALHPVADTATAGHETTYRFRIEDEDGPISDFDIEHTRPMHLIVVRRDFTGFQHLHPEMTADGTWETALTVPDPGAYRVFADFVVDGGKHTLGTDLFVAGDFQPQPLPHPTDEADAGDGYSVQLDGHPVAGEESELEFVVRHDGTILDDVPEYLGARGHLVALRDGDLAYLHVHADEDRLRFEATFPTPGEYRLYLQFRHGDEVRTAAFTVEVEEETR